jgi:hypothetical protein
LAFSHLQLRNESMVPYQLGRQYGNISTIYDIHDVINSYINASLDTVEEFAQNATNCSFPKKSTICLNCAGFFFFFFFFFVFLHHVDML